MERQKHVLRLKTLLEKVRKKLNQYLTVFETFKDIDFQRNYGTFCPGIFSYNMF